MAVADDSSIMPSVDDPDGQRRRPNMEGSTVTAFTDDVTIQDKQDVHDSLLLARLAAAKKFDVEERPRDWYNEFLKVLGNVGWKIKNKQFQEILQHSSRLPFKDFVFNTTYESASENEKKVIKKSLDDALSSAKKVEKFEDSISDGNKGHLEVGVATRQSTVGLTLLVNGYYFSMKPQPLHHDRRRSFRMQVDVSEMNLYVSTTQLQLNETVYGQVRQDIREKLETRKSKKSEKK